MDEEILPALEHRNEGRRVEARQQHVLTAPCIGTVDARFIGVANHRPIALIRRLPAGCRYRGLVAAKLRRLAKRVAEHDVRRRARAAGVACASLAQFDELEFPRRRHRIHIRASVDHRALAGEDVLARSRRDDRAGHAVGSIDGDGGVERIDGGDNVNRGVERALGGGVVGCARSI